MLEAHNGFNYALGCGLVAVSPSPDATTVPPTVAVRAYIKDYWNVSQSVWNKLRSSNSPILTQTFIQGSHTLCGSSYIFIDADANKKVNNYNGTNQPYPVPQLTSGWCSSSLPSK